jgi:hypothetical protein
LLDPVLTLLFLSAAGRILLSWLPAGEPGGHAPRELPVTWAAAFALGGIAVLYELLFQQSFQLYQNADREPEFEVFLVWFALGAVRIVTLPAGLVPRHAPTTVRIGALERGLLLLAVSIALAVILRRFDEYWQRAVGFAFLAAILLLLEHGLAVARRDARSRRMLLVLLAVGSWWIVREWGWREFAAALFCTLGAVGAVGWLRRADARGLWLSVAGLSAVVFLDPARWPIGAAGAVALVVATARPSRLLAAGCFGICIALAAIAMKFHWPELELGVTSAWIPPAALAAFGAAMLFLLPPASQDESSIDPPRREIVFLGLLQALSCSALVCLPDPIASGHFDFALEIEWTSFLPSAFLLLGLRILPAERISAHARP